MHGPRSIDYLPSRLFSPFFLNGIPLPLVHLGLALSPTILIPLFSEDNYYKCFSQSHRLLEATIELFKDSDHRRYRLQEAQSMIMKLYNGYRYPCFDLRLETGHYLQYTRIYLHSPPTNLQ